MPTQRLYPGAVSVTSATGAPEPVLVGDPPQWADDSDATYSQTVTTRTSSGQLRTPQAQAFIERFTGAAPEAVTGVALEVRGATSNGATRSVDFELRTGVGGSLVISFGRDFSGLWAWPTTDSIVDVSTSLEQGNFDLLGTSMLEVATALADNSTLITPRRLDYTAAGDYGLTIYELSIVVTWEGGGALAPLRQFPRDDRGRVWPSSSQQATNRRLGYY